MPRLWTNVPLGLSKDITMLRRDARGRTRSSEEGQTCISQQSQSLAILEPLQTEMQEGLALWFNQEALARKHNRVLPAGTGLIEMCLHYTPFLANWNQNNFKMLTFEWRQEACGCVFGLTGIRTWWGSEEVCSPGTSLLPLLEESVQRKERLSCLNYLLSKTKQKSVCSSENQEHLSHGSTFSPLQPC